MNPFQFYPIGSYHMDWLNHRVVQIVAHIKSQWLSVGGDWYGVASVQVSPSVQDHRSAAYRSMKEAAETPLWMTQDEHARAHREIVAGELPDLFYVTCINRNHGGPWLEPVKSHRILHPADNLTLVVSASRKHYLTLVQLQPGYPGSCKLAYLETNGERMITLKLPDETWAFLKGRLMLSAAGTVWPEMRAGIKAALASIVQMEPATLPEITAARALYQDDTVRIDDDALASRTDGGTVWVEAWVLIVTPEDSHG